MALGSWLLPKATPAARTRFASSHSKGIALFGITIPFALPYIQRVYLTLAEPGAGDVLLARLSASSR